MILCCGEALIDMLPAKTASGEDSFVPHAGGSVFNTAIALGRLKCPVFLYSGLSSDFFGDILRDRLKAAQVNINLSPIIDAPTALAFVRLVNQQAQYVFYHENTATRAVSTDQAIIKGNQFKALFFGGLSLVWEPSGTTYEALLCNHASSHLIMVDPNIRANFIADREAHMARMERIFRHTDIIKTSDEDLRWFTSDESQFIEYWLQKGVKLIIITRGEYGAEAHSRAGMIKVSSEPVKVADTVGAGDTFSAGFLASLYQHDLLNKSALEGLDISMIKTALTYAVKAASINITRSGANPPWLYEMQE